MNSLRRMSAAIWRVLTWIAPITVEARTLVLATAELTDGQRDVLDACDRLIADMGLYANDHRIAGVAGGDLVILRNGHTIERTSARDMWRLHNADGIAYQDRSWYGIGAALQNVLGRPETRDYANHVDQALAQIQESSC
jgi:hypothetical protein